MLGNEDAPVVIKTMKPFYRDGDYIEVYKSVLKDKSGKITYQDYTIEKNVSLIDECKQAKNELLIILGLKKMNYASILNEVNRSITNEFTTSLKRNLRAVQDLNIFSSTTVVNFSS